MIAESPATAAARARELFDRRFDEPLQVGEVARALGISRYQFIRAFRALAGVPPHSYVTERRLGRARELLRLTDLPVTDVCFSVGFESHGSFTTLFRRTTGMPPIAYRVAARRRREQASAIPACFLIQSGVSPTEPSPG